MEKSEDEVGYFHQKPYLCPQTSSHQNYKMIRTMQNFKLETAIIAVGLIVQGGCICSGLRSLAERNRTHSAITASAHAAQTH
jgi:hypothetical protein